MKSRCLISIAFLLLPITSVLAQAGGDDTARTLKDDPNNAAAIKSFVRARVGKIQATMRPDPRAALKLVDETSEILQGLAPDNDRAKAEVSRAQAFLQYVRRQIAVSQTPIKELAKKLEENSSDADLVSLYVSKVMQLAAELIATEPDKASKLIKDARALLEKLRNKAGQDVEAAKTMDRAEQSLVRIEQFIEDQVRREKKLAALIGKDAAPMKADAWINGDSLTDEDLKGKVVLLDFWAVWCGPCIRTFPHLRQWREKYRDKGLVIIGVTNYTKSFTWDAEKDELVESQSEVSPQDERAMLARFAQTHELHHVFAVQSGNEVAEYYAVESIPEVVLIDRAGKIRMVKVGAGPHVSQEIGLMLKELLGMDDEENAAKHPVIKESTGENSGGRAAADKQVDDDGGKRDLR